MDVSDLRVALFSGNYNYVRDGANQALNRLAGYLLKKGAAVRVYSPVTKTPAFPPTGDLIDLPAVPVPGRPEYRIGVAIPPRVRKDLRAFRPTSSMSPARRSPVTARSASLTAGTCR